MRELPPLTQVLCALRGASPAVASLPHVVASLSAFLDPTTGVSLPFAAASGSVHLLHRVACRVLQGAGSHALNEQLFARAMDAAIQQNDLLMVQKIHSLHPQPLVVPTLVLAMEHGSLELVQWVATHRSDQSCCPPGALNTCKHSLGRALARVGSQDPLRVVQWLMEASGVVLSELWAVEMNWRFLTRAVQSVELLRWLIDCGHLGTTETDNALWLAIEDPATPTDTVRLLVELHLKNKSSTTTERNAVPGRRPFLAEIARPDEEMENSFITSLFMASLHYGKEDTVEYLLSTPLAASLEGKVVYEQTEYGGAKVLQWTEEAMDDVDHNPGRTLQDMGLAFRAAHACHLETVEWLFEERDILELSPNFDSSVTEGQVAELYTWALDCGVEENPWPVRSIDQLASRGFLHAAKWVQYHGLSGASTKAMDSAAANGHLDFVKWLHATREEGCTSQAMNGAAGQGHLDVVQWLHENGYDSHTTSAMAWAAVGGQVDVLEWLHENRSDGCASCALREVLRAPRAYLRLVSAYPPLPMLNTLQWLRDHQPTDLQCQGTCLATGRVGIHLVGHLTSLAACAGDLELLEYLHEHHREEFERNHEYPDGAAAAISYGSCLNAVKWLYANQQEAIDWHLLLDDTRVTNPTIARWLETHTTVLLDRYDSGWN